MRAEAAEREKRAKSISDPAATAATAATAVMEEAEQHEAAAKLQAIQRGRAARRLTVNSAIAADDARRAAFARAAAARNAEREVAGEKIEERVQQASSYFVRVGQEKKPKRKRVEGARVSTFREASPGRDLPSQVRRAR